MGRRTESLIEPHKALAAPDEPVDGGRPGFREVLVIRPAGGWSLPGFRSLWEYRELLYFLVWRDVKVRYKQTVLGVAWAVIQPVMMMVIFTIVFSRFAGIPSDGSPYPVFTYAALLPWLYLSQAVSRGGTSLVGSAGLIGKVYFPRLLIPLSSVTTPLVDFLVSAIVLAGLMVWYGVTPTWGLATLPLFLLLALATALALNLWLSALNVRYRDVGYVIPYLVQVWMYASAVMYPASIVPEQWRTLFSLNPAVGVIEGFRWALLGNASPDAAALGGAVGLVLVLLLGGLIYFGRTERTFADVI